MNRVVRQKRIISNGDKNEAVHSARRMSFGRSMVVAVLIVLGTWFLLNVCSSWYSWKAVFLDNEQVFFGKFIHVPFTSKIVLRHAHYIKTNTNVNTNVNTDTEKNTDIDEKVDTDTTHVISENGIQNVIIAPITDMVHAPKTTRIIYKEHILYYETIQPHTSLAKSLNNSVMPR